MCRAYLSKWWEIGGFKPADENDKPVFRGRSNLGAISVNLPLIYIEVVNENPQLNNIELESKFFERLEFYLEEITNIHLKTFEYTAKQKAKTNPLGYTQGGFLGGNLNPEDNIESVIKSSTLSFGYTALNELQYLYSGKVLSKELSNTNNKDSFSYRTLDFINNFKDKMSYKYELLFAVYATPAESLCGTQSEQTSSYVENNNILENVNSDMKERIKEILKRGYFNNSYHMAVTDNISPIEKQDLEYEFFHHSNGGHIQYVRVPDSNNLNANRTLCLRAMDMGYYWGLNFNLDVCESCGHRWMPIKGADSNSRCPECDSCDIFEYVRLCGYMGATKIGGDSRINEAKTKDIQDRISM